MSTSRQILFRIGFTFITLTSGVVWISRTIKQRTKNKFVNQVNELTNEINQLSYKINNLTELPENHRIKLIDELSISQHKLDDILHKNKVN